MRLGIIGTAGRGMDGNRLTLTHWRMMCVIAQTVATMLGAKRLVSGGSAWSDHVAVQLYLDGLVDELSLHLPCQWISSACGRADIEQDCFDLESSTGRRLNELHDAFMVKTATQPLRQIADAIARGARIQVNHGGFLARNVDVAKEADALLAFTFAEGPEPNDGGTAHTWDQFKQVVATHWKDAYDHYEESACGCSSNIPPDDTWVAYHFSLANRRLYKTVIGNPMGEQECDRRMGHAHERKIASYKPKNALDDIDRDLL